MCLGMTWDKVIRGGNNKLREKHYNCFDYILDNYVHI